MDKMVRFCAYAGPGTTGANAEASKAPDFLRFETFAFHRWNATITYESGRDVCEQKLINNQTDILPLMCPFPRHHEHMQYITLMMDSKFMIMSSYVPIDHTIAETIGTDCLSGFSSFSSLRTLIVVLFMAAFYFLLRSKNKKKYDIAHIKPFISLDWYIRVRVVRESNCTRPKSNPSFMMIGLMLKQFSASTWIIRKKRVMFRFILILLMCFVSVIHFSFISSERTELVVIEKSDIMETYESVIHHKTAIPMWISYGMDHEPFMESPEGSVMHQIWQKARRHCRHNMSDCLVPMSRSNVMDYTRKFAHQERVLISNELASRVCHAGLCPLARMMGMNPLILRTDPNEKGLNMAIGYNRLMNERMPDVGKIVSMRGKKTFESGIILKLVIPTDSPITSLTTPSEVRKCLYPVNTTPDSVFLTKPWTDYWKLMKICITSYAVAAITLLTLKM